MKLKLFAAVLSGFFVSSAFAGEQFFEVGKTYLFVPRIDVVVKGTVTQITDQEIVFTNRSVLKASFSASKAKNDEESAKIKSQAIAEYLKSKNKDALLYSGPIKDIPMSYSRSEMTAIKIDG